MNSPKNPHHAGASGGTDISNIDKDSGNSHVLYGAVVGGPDQKDRFFDERSDYMQNEVALDYNAPFQSLVAYQLMTDAQDPPYVNITTPRPAVSRDDGSSSFPSWAIAVIVVVVVLFLVAVALTVYFLRKRRAKIQHQQSIVEQQTDDKPAVAERNVSPLQNSQ